MSTQDLPPARPKRPQYVGDPDAIHLTAPAKVYFLSAVLRSGDRITVSRERDEYVIRGGYGLHTLHVSATCPKRLDAHLAGYASNTERRMFGGVR